MTIDWDRSKLKAFRLALQDVYRDYEDLQIFLVEELGVDIADISEKTTLDKVTFRLLQKCDKDVVFEAFQQARPNHPVIVQLQQPPLVKRELRLLEADWVNLFNHFNYLDSPYLEIACRQAFKAVFNRRFEDIRPDYPSLNAPDLVQALLVDYDDPELTVRFVEAVMGLQQSRKDNDLDLTALEHWRDRIAEQYSVSQKPAELPKASACHAYLLVALEAIGSDVNVYPELHITGAENPIGFGAKPTTCSVDKVADQISEWIRRAEEALDPDVCDDEEVTLEVFLPCQHLEEDIATTWNVQDKRGDKIALGTYRRFLVRSSERIRDRKIQTALTRRWEELDACVKAKTACDKKFHLQEDCPQQKGMLLALLKDGDALGLKFVAQLPTDPGKRTDLLNDIIDAAIPIALWSSEVADAKTLETEFRDLLKQVLLTNFADLAKQWRRRRMVSPAAKHIRLLCDCPDRLPNLPDPDREEDLLAAS